MSDLENVLNAVETWLARFIVVPEAGDHATLALWAAHTHAMALTATTPRLLIDSSMPGSGKTTALEHLNALCHEPLLAASLGSPALLPRMLEQGPLTVLIDEADRTLNPKREGVGELLAVINAGYKRGSTRPVLVPGEGGTWVPKKFPTYAPVAMASNAPLLPDDTRSRCIRVLLMPDFAGRAEDTDWEEIEPEAIALRDALTAAVEQAEPHIAVKPPLPDACRGRMAEKWRPLARIAHAAGGRWPAIIEAAIVRDIAEVEAEREDGMVQDRPAVMLLKHLAEIWPADKSFVSTKWLCDRLAWEHPDAWGDASSYGRPLTEQRLGRLLSQGFKIHTARRNTDQGKVRGYTRDLLVRAWDQFNLAPPGETGPTGPTGPMPVIPGMSRSEPVREPPDRTGSASEPVHEPTSRTGSTDQEPRNHGDGTGWTGWTGSNRRGAGHCDHGLDPATCGLCEARAADGAA